MLGGATFAVVAVVAGSLFVQVPYFTIAPGSVWPTQGLISVEGAESYADQTTGEIGFTTVSLRHATAFEAAVGWLDSDVQVVSEDEILGGQSEEENRQANEQMMMTSQQVAAAVALEQLGYDVVRGTGAEILEVVPDLPADGVMEAGDTIVSVDGQDVQLWEDVVALVGSRHPGDSVTFGVESEDGVLREERAVLAADPEDPERGVLGVIGQTRDLELDLPIDVTIDAGRVGGPSAGLAFTLAVLDVLTPGDLTGGREVATTGTMALDGSVGPVGGVAQKTVAARESGVEVFLVPSSEYDEAIEHAGDMSVVAVDDLSGALEALDEIGGNALALGTPGDDAS